MIKNERQYRITRARVAEFQTALADAKEAAKGSKLSPRLRQAQVDAIQSQLETMKRELGDYDALQSGKRTVFTYDSLGDLPRALIEARIARRWTQAELAERLGLDKQKVADYEATDYRRASFARMLAVARALCITVREEVRLESA